MCCTESHKIYKITHKLVQHAYYPCVTIPFTCCIPVFDLNLKCGHAPTLMCFNDLLFYPAGCQVSSNMMIALWPVRCLRWLVLLLFLMLLNSGTPSIWKNTKQYTGILGSWCCQPNFIILVGIGQNFSRRHSRHVSFTVICWCANYPYPPITETIQTNTSCFYCAVVMNIWTVASFSKNALLIPNC